MSLLMDALRKAEQEKKAAAKKLREQGLAVSEQPASGRLSLSPQGEPHRSGRGGETATHQPDDNSGQSATTTRPGTGTINWEKPGSESQPTSLEFSQPLSAEHHHAHDAESHAESDPDTGVALDLDLSQSASADEGQGGADVTLALESLYEANTRSGTEALSADATDAGEKTELLDSVPAGSTTASDSTSNRKSRRHLSSDSYNSVDTPVTAQHIFAARKSTSPATLTVVVLVLLIVIGLASAGVFYYYSVTPAVRDIVSPRVAERAGLSAEHSQAIELPRPDQPANVTATGIDTAELATADSAGESATEAETAAPAPADEISGTTVQSGPANDPADTDTAMAETSPAADNAGTPESSDGDQDVATTVSAQSDDAIELKPELLQISRSTRVSEVEQAVSEAYSAYRRGDLAAARQLYRDALRRNSENRDAQLGLAAIAVQQQQYEAAYGYYRDILRRNPADRVARTALLTLQRQTDPATAEGQLKRMLDEEPQAAYLYQALGHVYVRTQRWAQAQQAYFDAYSRDSRNPNYAYNLAVSLEHLGKPQAALDYYRKALQLTQGSPVHFSQQAARDRIQQISQGIREP